MSFQTVSGQTITEPVTLEALKARLKLTSTADDLQLTGIITAAREFAERVSNRCLAPRQLISYRDGFPPPYEPIVLPLPLLVSVDLVEYLTVDPTTDVDTWTTWDASEYRVAAHNVPAALTAKIGPYPCPVRTPGNVRVTFTAGAGDIPQHWQLNIQDIAIFMYENAGVVVPTTLCNIPRIYHF